MPTTKKRQTKDNSSFVYWLLPIVFAFGLGLGYILWGTKVNNNDAGFVVSDGGDPYIGAKNAPITIIEFGDYQCGYCKKWYDEVLPSLMTAYPNKIRFVYRDFPIFAPQASAGAFCAREQDAYWEYHDLLFGQEYGLDDAAVLTYASDLGLNIQKFTQCLQAESTQQGLQADYNYGASIGVQSTPTFFINSRPLIGAQPLESFKMIIDEELAGSN